MTDDANISFDLERLLHPVEPGIFKTQYWETQPLILNRSDSSFYQHLLSLSDVDYILSHSTIRSSDIRLVQDGQELSISNLRAAGANLSVGGLEAVFQQYRKGATINLLSLHEHWPPLKRLCQSIAAELSVGVQVNVYLTPPNERGLKTHYDTHDVIVLQTYGAKRWRIYDSPIRLPLLDRPYIADVSKDPGSPKVDIMLNSGDLLYIPRGYLHDAASLGSSSLHLTIGIKPVTWASVILDSMQAVFDQDLRMRESLPPGFALDEALRRKSEAKLNELIISVCDQIKPDAAIGEASKRARLARYPSLEGHLLDLEFARLVGLGTRVRRRANIQWTLSRDTEFVYLHFHGKIVRMPASVEIDLKFIGEAGEFTASTLPGEFDPESKILLVCNLLREGFLTLLDVNVDRSAHGLGAGLGL
jgi:ribosomal protein L16 Arg81 hydroxylase